MNRRSFFSSLAALAGAASLSPHIFIPKFEPVKWKAPRIIRNPKWIVAEYRMIMFSNPPIYDRMIFHRREPDETLTPSGFSIIKVGGNKEDYWGEWKFETP